MAGVEKSILKVIEALLELKATSQDNVYYQVGEYAHVSTSLSFYKQTIDYGDNVVRLELYRSPEGRLVMDETIDVFFSKEPFTLNVKNTKGEYTLESKQTTVDELITYILKNFRNRWIRRELPSFENILKEIRDNPVEKIPADVDEVKMKLYCTPIEFVYNRPFSYRAGDVELKKLVYVDDILLPSDIDYQVIAEDETVRVLYPKITNRNGRIKIPPVYVNTKLKHLEYDAVVKPREVNQETMIRSNQETMIRRKP